MLRRLWLPKIVCSATLVALVVPLPVRAAAPTCSDLYACGGFEPEVELVSAKICRALLRNIDELSSIPGNEISDAEILELEALLQFYNQHCVAHQ